MKTLPVLTRGKLIRRPPEKRGRGRTTCSWCERGEVPHPSEGGVCDCCVLAFRRILQSKQWGRQRRAYLAERPLCVCDRCTRTLPNGSKEPRPDAKPSEDVDHVKPWRDRPDLFYDTDNWQPLAHSCHSRKTQAENPSPTPQKKRTLP